MIRKTLVASFALWVFLAHTAYANVRINEIAWMGTLESGTNEWIELYNDMSTAVDLTGWQIVADDGSPTIALAGEISPNGYYLIERTDDATVPTVTADLVTTFGTGLSNAGEILTLKDSGIATIDTVSGLDGWSAVGGNNQTKETAQRTTSGWITATGTPRAINATGGGEVLGASTVSTQNSSNVATETRTVSGTGAGTGASGGSGIPSPYPRKNITVFAGEDQAAFVGFPVSFSGRAVGLYDEALNNGTYRWNFGDGATGEGQTTAHTYLFAGEYVVTLEVFRGENHNTDRLSITASEPTILINKVVVGDGGFIELVNHSSREVDLSLWRVEDKAKNVTFVLPPRTALLAGKTLILPNATTHLGAGARGMFLMSPDGTVIHSWNVSRGEENEAVMASQSYAGFAETSRTQKGKLPMLSGGAQGASATDTEVVLWSGEENTASSTRSIFALSGDTKEHVVLGLTLLLVVVALVILLRGDNNEDNPLKDYEIIEDIIEGADDEDSVK